MFRSLFTALLVATSLALSPALFGQQTDTPPKSKQGKVAEKQDQAQGQRGQDMGMVLIRGLKKIKGCIDVKTCQWSDGKQSIVAWFENKKAAVSWYNSATHQAIMGGRTDGTFTGGKPLEHVKDEKQPIMVIATLTPAKKPELEGVKIPISQISIELFAPLPGGAQIGGRVSPEGFKVPHMRNYNSPKKKQESPK